MAVPKAPPKVVQQRLVGKALLGQVPSADMWEYAVSEDWLTQYKQELFEESGKAINIYPLYVSPDGAGNTFIAEGQWKILVSWYGLADDSSLLRRPMVPQYIPIYLPSGQDSIFPNNSLDFLPVSIGHLEHLQNPKHYHYVQIYFWEQFTFLEMVARRLLKIPSSSGARLWVSVAMGDQDVILKCVDQSIQNWFSCLGSLLCAENTTILEEMRSRQALFMQGVPPDAPQQSLSASSKKHMHHLDDVFDKHGLVITISIEEISPKMKNQGTSTFDQQESSILGEVAQFVSSSAKPQSEWDEVLHESLQQLAVGVNEAVVKNTSVIYDKASRIVGDKVACVEKEKAELEKLRKRLDSKEATLTTTEKDQNERQQDLDTKVAKFKQSLTDFLVQKKKLEDDLNRIESQNKISERRVELNVGGVHFTTSTATLTQEKESVLASMFNGRHAVHQEKDGSYFIDRDGTHFRYILNFLRERATAVESFPHDHNILKELLTEAKYYHLLPLITALEAKLNVSNAKKS